MLRTYKPLQHPIFELHSQLEYLICQVWCNASNEATCEELMEPSFVTIYKAYDWLKNAADNIYEECKSLTINERADIREAFNINNRIEELCEGKFEPISLDKLPDVVNNLMRPLLIRFYNDLLNRALVAGNKLDYYNKLILKCEYTTCPCCGLSLIETAESHYVEDNDHYLPKEDYPFAVVNFSNLVPLCSKCNKKCKGEKNPFENRRVSFYPFNGTRPNIQISTSIVESDDLDYRTLRKQDIELKFDSDANKVSTWNWLFNIEERYNEQIRGFSKIELRIIANRLYRNNKRKTGLSYSEIFDDTIVDYEQEIYEDRKFLKVSFLKEIKNKPEWQSVYINDIY